MGTVSERLLLSEMEEERLPTVATSCHSLLCGGWFRQSLCLGDGLSIS